jgi:hypothetical protein
MIKLLQVLKFTDISLIFQGKTHFRGKLNYFSKGIFRKKSVKNGFFSLPEKSGKCAWNLTINK